MKVGIMQPYFLPYPGYFSLISRCDKWVVFDIPQYIRHGWVNRNRVLHPTKGWQYIGVPLKKHSRDTAIKDIRITEDSSWAEKIMNQLAHYKKKAPNYENTMEFLAGGLHTNTELLVDLNVDLMKKVCRLLEIDFDYIIASHIEIDMAHINGPGDWALEISRILGASEYINPPGGEDLFDRAAFQEAGIKLSIQAYENMQYACPGYEFEPGLSIVDAMMWNSSGQIREHLLGGDI